MMDIKTKFLLIEENIPFEDLTTSNSDNTIAEDYYEIEQLIDKLYQKMEDEGLI
jgi:hypothetical protein